MIRYSDKKRPDLPEHGSKKEDVASRGHAGNKPRLSDEQAHAELRRRQREREGGR
jgi:hypothetical protein